MSKAKALRKRRVSEDQHYQLWRLAVEGDADATNEIAKSLLKWVESKAADYEKRFNYQIPIADFISAGMAKVVPTIKAFKPRRGVKFFGFFCSNASRAMVDCFEYANRTPRRHHIDRPDIPDSAAAPTQDHDHEQAALIDRAIAFLTPIERAYAKEWAGITNPNIHALDCERTAKRMAKWLQISVEQATEIHDGIKAKLRRLTEAERLPGKPRDKVTGECIKLARKRRSEGVAWKAITKEIRAIFGRHYTLTGLQSMVSRRVNGGADLP